MEHRLRWIVENSEPTIGGRQVFVKIIMIIIMTIIMIIIIMLLMLLLLLLLLLMMMIIIMCLTNVGVWRDPRQRLWCLGRDQQLDS